MLKSANAPNQHIVVSIFALGQRQDIYSPIVFLPMVYQQLPPIEPNRVVRCELVNFQKSGSRPRLLQRHVRRGRYMLRESYAHWSNAWR